jgi:hypothetical protein
VPDGRRRLTGPIHGPGAGRPTIPPGADSSNFGCTVATAPTPHFILPPRRVDSPHVRRQARERRASLDAAFSSRTRARGRSGRRSPPAHKRARGAKKPKSPSGKAQPAHPPPPPSTRPPPSGRGRPRGRRPDSVGRPLQTLALRSYGKRSTQRSSQIGRLKLSAVTRNHLQDIAGTLTADGLAPSTVRNTEPSGPPIGMPVWKRFKEPPFIPTNWAKRLPTVRRWARQPPCRRSQRSGGASRSRRSPRPRASRRPRSTP